MKQKRRNLAAVQWIFWLLVIAVLICKSRASPDTAFSSSSSVDPPTDREQASSPVRDAEPEPDFAPSSTSLPKVVLPPTVRVVSPSIQPIIPTVQPPAQAVPATIGWARNIAPSVSDPSDGPTVTAHGVEFPPSYPKPPPIPVFHAEPPRGGSQITTAHAPVSPPERIPVAAPPTQTHKLVSPVNGSPPASSPVPLGSTVASGPATSDAEPPTAGRFKDPAMPPALPNIHKQKAKKRTGKPASAPLYPPPSTSHSPVISPTPIAVPKSSKKHHHRAPPLVQDHSLSPKEAPSPLPVIPSLQDHRHSPSISPESYPKEPKLVSPEPVWVLPPPPPNLDCNWLQCSEPFINPPPGSPCVCVLPIKVGLRLSVTLYTFFPSVSEFAQEIASSINMKLSQVRIMGANVATKEPEKTTVLIDLVPLEEKFDNSSAFVAYGKFWHRQITVNSSLFGNYDVLYVLYPGLPPSPPAAPASINFADGTFGDSNNSRTMKPLGVNVPRAKRNVSHSMITLVVLSSFIALAVCVGAIWLLLLKLSDCRYLPASTPHRLLPVFAKTSGTGHVRLGNKISSASASLSSSFATYSGSAKTFNLHEIERATDRFDDSKIIGEGGFGRVYQGVLEDGTKVAVKILKRDDQQGEREFLAEVEMLNRLHHRNLVKLIGICTEENVRCVVYELIPNGSVESHLHGVHKQTAPLDWNARMKIALGAARGLAYLHEDSSPPVIHRDFKSSNILLEDDYTPKVSDFGLARAALNEGNGHISTRVMGTFGYVAPEYAMTGHLLVKSDVYSYGVVLLELLTGKKPVDMLQPQGQENLVTWARPLLTSIDGLQTIIDPALSNNVPFENAAKVAAIASMCVQPEVSHRPFMGEVVQALKLVCNECDDNKGTDSIIHNDLSSYDTAIRIATWSALEANRELSASDILYMSETRNDSGLFQWRSCSGPQRTGKDSQFWQRLRSFSTGSISDHAVALKLRTNSDGNERWS